jgi:hypothetical protein
MALPCPPRGRAAPPGAVGGCEPIGQQAGGAEPSAATDEEMVRFGDRPPQPRVEHVAGEQIDTTLSRAGFCDADILRVITLMDCFVLGSALDLAAPVDPWESGAEVGPELAAALATGGEKPGRADDAFEFGLAVVLRGLADLRSR